MTSVIPDLRTQFDEIDGNYHAAIAHHRELLATLAADLDGDDVADTGTKMAVAGEDEAEIRRLAERREQMEQALKRLEAGTYGVCESCAQQIHAERLALMPTATHCVACKQKTEHRR